MCPIHEKDVSINAPPNVTTISVFSAACGVMLLLHLYNKKILSFNLCSIITKSLSVALTFDFCFWHVRMLASKKIPCPNPNHLTYRCLGLEPRGQRVNPDLNFYKMKLQVRNLSSKSWTRAALQIQEKKDPLLV